MSDTSCQTIKPKKITWILLSPFILITMICNAISAGITYIIDKPWYEESMRQQRQNNTSHTKVIDDE